VTDDSATPDAIWLGANWPFVNDHLPPAPAAVIELGCGASGGHVPALARAGYQATGVDPEAPDGPRYQRVRFEDYQAQSPADAVVASTSLHHVDDVAAALDHVAGALVPGGRLIVLEWISEDFDEPTARWCFRHAPTDPAESGAWLAELRADWEQSGLSWGSFYDDWLGRHGLHPAAEIRRELAARFAAISQSTGPYYFADLPGTDAAQEQAAIDAGAIRAGCLRYAGQLAR
jgi:SAM-dependent methyltransferase